MKRLSAVQVLFIQSRLVVETGGVFGLRDPGLLESACARPFASFDRRDLSPDIFSMAAALMHSLINTYPFVDGNKRVGLASALIFLQQNGVLISIPQKEIVRFTLDVARGNENLSSIACWLRAHSLS